MSTNIDIHPLRFEILRGVLKQLLVSDGVKDVVERLLRLSLLKVSVQRRIFSVVNDLAKGYGVVAITLARART